MSKTSNCLALNVSVFFYFKSKHNKSQLKYRNCGFHRYEQNGMKISQGITLYSLTFLTHNLKLWSKEKNLQIYQSFETCMLYMLLRNIANKHL